MPCFQNLDDRSNDDKFRRYKITKNIHIEIQGRIEFLMTFAELFIKKCNVKIKKTSIKEEF